MEKLTKTGIDIIGDVPWGTHFCQFYQTKEDLLDVLVPYFRAGLENKEFCMWITSEPLSEEDVLEAMRKALPNFDQYLKKGQIEILPHTEWYLKGGEFDSQRVLDGWVDKLNQALAKGYKGLRLTGNTFWLEKRDWRRFADYENEVNNVIGKYQMIAVCTYSLDKCGANEVIDVVSNHQFALTRREGKWELIESFERRRAEEALRYALEESKRRQAEVSALLESSRAVLEYHKFKDAARFIFDSCKNLIGATAGYIALLSKDSKENEVLFLDSGGLPCAVDPSLPMPIRGLRKEAYRSGQAVFENEFSKSEYMKFMPEGHVNLDNVLFAPLAIKGKVIGLLGIANKSGGFAENDARLASAFGELAAVALYNSQTLEALERSQERLRSVVETASDAIISVDSGGHIIFWNQGAEYILGYAAQEVIGRPINFIIPERFREAHLKAISRLISSGDPKIIGRTVEMFGLRKDGSEFPLELSLATWNIRGEIFFTGIIRDITERKKMEEELRRSHAELEQRVKERTAELRKTSELLELVFSSIDLLIAYLDRDFNFIRVNRAYAEADEREPEFYVGKNHFALFPNEENEAIFRRVVETGLPYFVYEKPFVYAEHPGRGVTYWDWSLHPVKEPDGQVGGVILSLVNVTERKRAEEARARLISILEATSDFVAFASPEGQVLYLNHAARRTLGIGQDEDISKLRIPDTYPPWVNEIVLNEGIPTAIRKGIWNGETAFLRRDGREIPVSQVILAHKSSTGNVEFLSTIARDISEQKEEEKRMRIRNALSELFAKKASRKEYLDAVVHLLREWSNCRCAGVRVLDGKGFIPYASYVGFDQEFWESENWLSVENDQCACIGVVMGELDPQELSVVTPGGSFCCGNTVQFIEKLSAEERKRYRGVCVQKGFLSVAIIPIRYHEKIIGAIHLTDEGEGVANLKAIEFIESMAPLIGEAVHRFNLEDELRESEKRLRHLSSQLITAQEIERKRVAQELHDSIGQALAATKFTLERKLSQMNKGTAPPGILLEEVISMMQHTIEESRRISMDLWPSILDDLGILPAINWFCRNFETIYPGISIEKQVHVEEKEVPNSLKVVIYRILQESLNNVVKHSKADRVCLTLRKTDGLIEQVIEDNGVGFDPENANKGLGLSSMKERVELSGGTFAIESIIGAGTTLKAKWPLSRDHSFLNSVSSQV